METQWIGRLPEKYHPFPCRAAHAPTRRARSPQVYKTNDQSKSITITPKIIEPSLAAAPAPGAAEAPAISA